MNGRRLTSRDYKGAQRRNFDLRHWREFAFGLGVGLAVALVVFVGDRRALRAAAEAQVAAARAEPPAGAAEDAAGGGTATDENYAFYDMLPKFEVVVPEKERDVRRVDSAARIDRPGTYFLQAGSYRRQSDAERVATQLARQDIAANVQRVAVDNDVWHRVRIGPITDLNQLNRIRQRLQAADVDTLVIRVDE